MGVSEQIETHGDQPWVFFDKTITEGDLDGANTTGRADAQARNCSLFSAFIVGAHSTANKGNALAHEPAFTAPGRFRISRRLLRPRRTPVKEDIDP